MRKLRGSREGQLYQESLEPVETDPRLSQHIRALQPTGRGAEHDKILEYGAQLNDIALQLQEWVSIYQSHEGNEGGGALFSINAPKNARAVQQLGYAKDGLTQGQERVAFGRTSGHKSARSASSRKRGRRSRSHSRSRSFSRSKSREGKQFIRRIEKLRQNLEVEGQAIHSYFRKTDDDRQQKKTQSDKMTISQYKAANQLLKRQNRDMGKKQAAKDRLKNANDARQEMIRQARGKVMNYAVRENDEDDKSD